MKKKRYPIEDAAANFLNALAKVLTDAGYFYFRKKKNRMDYLFIALWHFVLIAWAIVMSRR